MQEVTYQKKLHTWDEFVRRIMEDREALKQRQNITCSFNDTAEGHFENSQHLPTFVKSQFTLIKHDYVTSCRSQWPLCLRRWSAVARLLGLRVRISSEAMEVCLSVVSVVCSDELIPRPEKSYQTWRVDECDLETSWMRRPWPTGKRGGSRQNKTNKQTNKKVTNYWVRSWLR
jgi:hypothetical protein